MNTLASVGRGAQPPALRCDAEGSTSGACARSAPAPRSVASCRHPETLRVPATGSVLFARLRRTNVCHVSRDRARPRAVIGSDRESPTSSRVENQEAQARTPLAPPVKEPSATGGDGSSSSDEGEGAGGASSSAAIGTGSAVLGALVVVAIAAIAAGGYFYKDELNQAVDFFSKYIEAAGPLGYVAFTFGYAALEILAIPAIPLTMSAGLLFGPIIGTAVCSAAATMAATGSFLIARYVARERILRLVAGNKKFLAIDRALGEDSFRVVTLLRLSPLLPFSLGNYVYGLTSIQLTPYVLGSWLGMLPGTYAYVSAGAFGRTLLDADEAGLSVSNSSLWSVLAGLGVTVAAAAYVGNLAKNAMKDIE